VGGWADKPLNLFFRLLDPDVGRLGWRLQNDTHGGDPCWSWAYAPRGVFFLGEFTRENRSTKQQKFQKSRVGRESSGCAGLPNSL
jgi:hypothetical protein